jgi:hypothetical protein
MNHSTSPPSTWRTFVRRLASTKGVRPGPQGSRSALGRSTRKGVSEI